MQFRRFVQIVRTRMTSPLSREGTRMRRETVVQALAELEYVLPTMAGGERARLGRVEARLRAVLGGRCGIADGCIDCPGQCAMERIYAPAGLGDGEGEAGVI